MCDRLGPHGKGWTPVYKEYPPFFKTLDAYIVEYNRYIAGRLVVSGGDNRFCIVTEEGKYYDVDKYIMYWKVKEQETGMKIKLVKKGGSGSGNYGHAGRPGEVGGSASGGSGYANTQEWHVNNVTAKLSKHVTKVEKFGSAIVIRTDMTSKQAITAMGKLGYHYDVGSGAKGVLTEYTRDANATRNDRVYITITGTNFKPQSWDYTRKPHENPDAIITINVQ